MKSIQLLLLGFTPAIAAATLLFGEARKTTIATTNWRDLTVNGRGHIHTVDQRNENPIWLRSIQLGINHDGQLCSQRAGELRPLEPRVTIPSDFTRIDIAKDGSVTIESSGNVATTVGQISLSIFSGDIDDEVFHQRHIENRIDTPMACLTGSNGAGHLDQYTTIQFCIPITWRTVAYSIVFGCAACYILVSWKSKMP